MQILVALLLVILAMTTGCSQPSPMPTDENSVRSLFLKQMLDAHDDRDFSKALTFHGPVTDADVPEILAATKNWESKKRRNGARALLILRSDKSDAVQAQFVADVSDVDAWAILLGGFRVLEHHPDWAGKRPDLIKKGLDSSKPETKAAAIRAGAISHYPGIEAVIEKLLDDKNPRIREVCLESMTPEMSVRFLPRMKEMMRELNSTPRSDSSGYRELLVMALLASGNAEMRKTIRDYYEAGEGSGRLEFASMLNIHSDRWIEDLLWEYWQTPDKREADEKYLYPVQANALDTMLWHITQKKDFEVKPRWVEACVAAKSRPGRLGLTLDEDCAKLAYFVSGKPQGREWLDDKGWTVRMLKEWLAAHPG